MNRFFIDRFILQCTPYTHHTLSSIVSSHDGLFFDSLMNFELLALFLLSLSLSISLWPFFRLLKYIEKKWKREGKVSARINISSSNDRNKPFKGSESENWERKIYLDNGYQQTHKSKPKLVRIVWCNLINPPDDTTSRSFCLVGFSFSHNSRNGDVFSMLDFIRATETSGPGIEPGERGEKTRAKLEISKKC